LFYELKTVLSTLFLILASYQDLKTREIDDKIWFLMGASGIIINAVQFFIYREIDLLIVSISTILTVFFALTLYYSGLFGGADSKALISLLAMYPFTPRKLLYNRVATPFFPLDVFMNSLVISLFIPIAFFFYNTHLLIKGEKIFEGINANVLQKILALFLGKATKISNALNQNYIALMEDIYFKDNKLNRKLKFMFNISVFEENNTSLLNLLYEKHDVEWVWITPGLPFIVSILFGFLLTISLGNIIYIFISKHIAL